MHDVWILTFETEYLDISISFADGKYDCRENQGAASCTAGWKLFECSFGFSRAPYDTQRD